LRLEEVLENSQNLIGDVNIAHQRMIYAIIGYIKMQGEFIVSLVELDIPVKIMLAIGRVPGLWFWGCPLEQILR
jgi:hypothetical protein